MQDNGQGLYARFFKRFIDLILSTLALVLLSPLLLLLALIGAYMMKGNPFFVQPRPGRNEQIFNLVKFRTMSNAKDENGNLLPDELRINTYGTFLRSTSLDELPELFNICKGDMSIVGPRPLLVKYLPYYTEQERQRHLIRPGLTGYAQVHGRNAISWSEKFDFDIWYVNHISLFVDCKVILDTIKIVFAHEGIALNCLEDFDDYRRGQIAANSDI